MQKLPIALGALVLTSLLSANPTTPVPAGIQWQHGSLEAALKSSTLKSGLTLVYFWADGSDYCGKLYTETLSKPEAAKAVDGLVCFNAKHSEATAELFKKYSVQTLPTMLFLKPDGEPEDVITGFIPVASFDKEVQRIKRAEGTHSGILAELAKHEPKSEKGIAARWILVGKLQELNLTDQATTHTQKIRELDPSGDTDAGGTLKLNQMMNDIFAEIAPLAPEEQRAAIRAADFSEVYAFAKSSKSQVTRFNAWSSLARVQTRREDYVAAKEAAVKSIKECADENRAGWCNSLAGWAVNNEGKISSKDRKFAEQLSQRSVKMTRAIRKAAKKGNVMTETDSSDPFEKAKAATLKNEIADNTLAQRLTVLAQVQFMNRKRDKAKKTIKEAATLASDSMIQVVAGVKEKIHAKPNAKMEDSDKK